MLRGFFATIIALFFSVSDAISEPVSLHLSNRLVTLAPRLSQQVAKLAADAARCAASREGSGRMDTLAVIDYSLPSTEKRFWLFDLARSRLLIEDLVAHGRNSGENEAASFSNVPGSLQSSLGIFRVGESYLGKHGASLRLIGLEPGINDRALDRAIVIHGAEYVSEDFIRQHRRLGRSFGCPVLNPASTAKVINTFRERNGFLFSYYPDEQWLNSSAYVNGCT